MIACTPNGRTESEKKCTFACVFPTRMSALHRGRSVMVEWKAVFPKSSQIASIWAFLVTFVFPTLSLGVLLNKSCRSAPVLKSAMGFLRANLELSTPYEDAS